MLSKHWLAFLPSCKRNKSKRITLLKNWENIELFLRIVNPSLQQQTSIQSPLKLFQNWITSTCVGHWKSDWAQHASTYPHATFEDLPKNLRDSFTLWLGQLSAIPPPIDPQPLIASSRHAHTPIISGNNSQVFRNNSYLGKSAEKHLPVRRYSHTFRQFADFGENCEESDSTPSEKGGWDYRSHLITTCESVRQYQSWSNVTLTIKSRI